MKIIDGGVTAAKGFKAAAAAAEIKCIRAERIWLWFTVRCLVWLRGLLLPM